MRSLLTLGKSVDLYGDLLVPIMLNKLPPKTRKNMVREHDNNKWNLSDLQEAIQKEMIMIIIIIIIIIIILANGDIQPSTAVSAFWINYFMTLWNIIKLLTEAAW